MNRETPHGFDFGSMSVTRTCQDEKSSVISVKTPKASFSIRVTKTGQLRFFDEYGNECELIMKDYLKTAPSPELLEE